MVEITSSHEEDSLHGESLPPPPDMNEDNDVIEEHVGGIGGECEDIQLTGCGASACCDPRKGVYRFSALFFMCLGFGSYFCYDTPGSLQDQIKDDMGVNTVGFASLYSLYSWPNVVLCFIGGFLIDRVFGIRWGTIIFSTLVTVGQFIYATGAVTNQFWLMQTGRFVFGVGGESLAVAQNTYTVSWFKGKELNTVFGLQLSMARVGSTVNFLSMGPIYAWVDTFADGYKTLGISLLIAGATCIFSLICAVILGLLDKRRSKVLGIAESGEKVQLRDILTFPLSFWLLCVICVSYYVAIFPFIGLAKVFFMRKFDFDEASANGVSSIVYVISAFASPILGYIVDRLGRNILWVFIAVLVSFAPLPSHGAMSVLGLAYSLLASALWPMVSLIIPEHQLGSAYGMMQSIQNLGLALISMLAGLIVDLKGYLVLEMFYMIWLCVALISTVVMWLTDSASRGVLNLTVAERRNRESDRERLLSS
ncbi:hypothetical protein C7M84_014409 [Penaeus vannamei]|uniref:Lysosomal dipeptide transporter MFSD1 n=1 Tax=Penaeus vannamei TaxID=6689 RepID=A0A3R7LZI9_PENVA|nr:hypothetical protein C7M84_014409 [Penaeus vannamei]